MATRTPIKNPPAAKKAAAAITTPRRTINPTPVAVSKAASKAAGEVRQPTESGERVTVTIPKNFSLTLDDHSQVHYKAGVDEMPLEHATHWYSQAMGVEVYQRGE